MDKSLIKLIIQEYLELNGYNKTLEVFDDEIPSPGDDSVLMSNLEKLISLGLSCDVAESMQNLLGSASYSGESDPAKLPIVTDYPKIDTEIIDKDLVETDFFDQVFPSSGIKDGVPSNFSSHFDPKINNEIEYTDPLDPGFVELVPTSDILITQTRFCDLCEMIFSEVQDTE